MSPHFEWVERNGCAEEEEGAFVPCNEKVDVSVTRHVISENSPI
jgi:hypothetical protein